MLRFGLEHTIVLDKDSKFYAVFAQSCLLLDLNVHTVSSENHDAIIVERVSRYLNKGLKIFTQNRGTPSVSREAIWLIIYAWNSCPVPLTDTTQSMTAYWRYFPFPIDFSHETAVKLTSSKQWVDTFSAEQSRLLFNIQEIASLCIAETRVYHCKRINELRQDPRVFEIGDIMLAKRAVKSNKSRHIFDKTEFVFTGLW